MATYDIDNLIRELSVVGNLRIAKVTDSDVTITLIIEHGEHYESRRSTIGEALADIRSRYNGVRLE
jgi:hypothetical protein